MPFASMKNVGLEDKRRIFCPFSISIYVCIENNVRVPIFGIGNTLLEFLLSSS